MDCGSRLAFVHSYTLLGPMTLLSYILMWQAQMWTSPAFPLGPGLNWWMIHAYLAKSWQFLLCSATASGKPKLLNWTSGITMKYLWVDWAAPARWEWEWWFPDKTYRICSKESFLNRSICPLSFLFYYLWLRWVEKRLKLLRTMIKRRHWQDSGGTHL